MLQKIVVILDPAVGSRNIGDEIISSAVQGIVQECSSDMVRIVRFSVHQKLSAKQLNAVKEADVIIAGGSNLLNLRYIPFRDARWNNTLLGLLKLKNVWLLGAGWSSYDDNSNWLGRFLYKNILSKAIMHSVRDEFSRTMLNIHGVDNVINTACPTMWGLDSKLISKIPKKKADSAVFTLTDYSRDMKQDGKLIRSIRDNYREVFFWPQGFSDLKHLQSFSLDGIKILRPTLSAFDELLATHDSIDYVGTRLHAGIRAMQHKRRSSIVAVDNRALEISRDSGIPIVNRDVVEEFDSFISGDVDFNISLPFENIEVWKEQLRQRLA